MTTRASHVTTIEGGHGEEGSAMPTTYQTVFLGYGGELLLDAFDRVAPDIASADGASTPPEASLEETLQRLRGQLVDGG